MSVSRTKLFIFILAVFFLPLIAVKLIWIARSIPTQGIYSFKGMGHALDQMRPSYTVLYFKHAGDTIWFHGPPMPDVQPGEIIPVRYQPNDPTDVRVATMIGLWGGMPFYCGLILCVLLVIFFTKDVFPRGSNIRLMKNRALHIK